jgi:hypothetical protein
MLWVIASCKKKEKEKQVVKLAVEGKTIKEIAKAVHLSLKDMVQFYDIFSVHDVLMPEIP